MKTKDIVMLNEFQFPTEIFDSVELFKHTKILTFRKNELLTEESIHHNNVCIIKKGVVVMFWKDVEQNTTIIDFKSVGEVLRPAIEIGEIKIGKIFAEALSKTEVMLIDRQFLCTCSLESNAISDYYYGLLTGDIDSTYMQLKLLKEADLGKRYQIFLEEYKHIYNKISDRMVANYLGVHFTTLSRVKARILGKERQTPLIKKVV